MAEFWFWRFVAALIYCTYLYRHTRILERKNRALRRQLEEALRTQDQKTRDVVVAKTATAEEKPINAYRPEVADIDLATASDEDAFAVLAAKVNGTTAPATTAAASTPRSAAAPTRERTGALISRYLVPGIDFAMQGPKGLLSLFYLGAFFIIIAALLFVNSSMLESLPGIKSLVLVAVTLAFAAGGFVLARDRRLRVAGIIYAGIALLFIPIAGIAYYNFSAATGGSDGSIVWLVSSLAFVGLSFLYYRSVLKNPLMYQFILLGVLSATWSLAHIVEADLTTYCLASVVYGYVLYALARRPGENAPVLRGSGVVSVIGGVFVGTLCQWPGFNELFSLLLSDRLGVVVMKVGDTLSWATQPTLIFFPLAAFLFCSWYYYDHRSDSAWHGVVASFLGFIAAFLGLSQVADTTWCAVAVILAFVGLALMVDTRQLSFLTPKQRHVFSWLAPTLLWLGAWIGTVVGNTQPSVYNLTLGQIWLVRLPAVVFSLSALVYYAASVYFWRRGSDVICLLIWWTELVGLGLTISDAGRYVAWTLYLIQAPLAYSLYRWLGQRELLAQDARRCLRVWADLVVAFVCLTVLGYSDHAAATLYHVAGFAYFAWRYLTEPQAWLIAAGELTQAAAMITFLNATDQPTLVYGWCFYLLAALWAGLGLVKTALWRPHEQALLRESGSALMALTFVSLVLFGYGGNLLDLPLLFGVIPLIYLIVRMMVTPHTGWTLGTFLWGLAIGIVVLVKLDDTGALTLESWSYWAWAQLYALAFAGVVAARARRALELGQPRPAAPLLGVYLGVMTLASVGFAFVVGGHDYQRSVWLTVGQIWQLGLLAISIALGYVLTGLYATSRDRYLNVSALWIYAWWLLVWDLGLQSPQWIIQPTIYYFVVRSLIHDAQGRRRELDVQVLCVCACLSAFFYRALSDEVGILAAILTGVATTMIGYRWREQILRRLGVAIAVLVVLLMFASAILGLAPEVWLAIIGLGLLAVATYTLRRHQK